MALILLVRPWSLSPYILPLRPSLLNTSTPSLLTHLHSLIPYTLPLHSLHTQIPLWVSPPSLHTSTPSLFTHLHSFTPCMHTSPLWGLPHSLHTSTSSLLTYLHSLTPYIPPLPHSLHTSTPSLLAHTHPPCGASLSTYLSSFPETQVPSPNKSGLDFLLSRRRPQHLWTCQYMRSCPPGSPGSHPVWGS